MKGKIINYDDTKSFGFIMGENGQTYFFHASNTNAPFEICLNKMVTFHPTSNQKGFRAENVVLGKMQKNSTKQSCTKPKNHHTQKAHSNSQRSQKKNKFYRIKDLTVNLNDVKRVEIQENGVNEDNSTCYKLVIRTFSSGVIVNYYNDYGDGDWGRSNYKEAREDLDALLSALN